MASRRLQAASGARTGAAGLLFGRRVCITLDSPALLCFFTVSACVLIAFYLSAVSSADARPNAASGVRICWVIHSDLGGSLPVALIDRAIPGARPFHAVPLASLIALVTLIHVCMQAAQRIWCWACKKRSTN